MPGAIRVAVVDDHPLYRDGVVALLSCSGAFDVVAEGECADDALRIASDHEPDVMILDVNMPGDGLAAARRLKELHPATKIVMLTVSHAAGNVLSALSAGGAFAYIVKGVTGPEFERALYGVCQGTRYVSPELAAGLLAENRNEPDKVVRTTEIARLSSRETQIATHVSKGLTNKEIARALTLSEKTVKYYMTIIMQKLHVHNRLQVGLVVAGKSPGSNRDAPVATAEH